MKQLEFEFTNLVKEHKTSIFTVCYMFSSDEDEVNDMFQETLVNLWRGYEKFRGESKISTWIWRVALNTCISWQRKKKETVPLDLSMKLYADDGDSDLSQIRMLHKRIQRLQPFDKAIVLLWLEGLSYQEIAEIMGVKESNVGVRLYRIKEQLKNQKQEEE